MSFKTIQSILDSRLASLPGATPIAWENIKFTPVLNREWLRPTLLNGESQQICMSDGEQNNPGIYRVDAFYPIGNGIGNVLAKLDTIYSHFKAQPRLQNGSIIVLIRNISVLQRIATEDSWLMGSVNINFACYDNLAA